MAKITDPKHPGKVLDTYIILDDQSNTSFADSTVFDFFNAEPNLFGYSLSTLGSKTLNSGRRITGLKIRGALENRTYDLPSLFEIVEMPDTKDEVATPEIVCQHKHLEHLASRFPSFQQDTPVLLLLGRDSGTVMKPLDYVNMKELYAHRTTLGWAVIGSVCQGRNRQQRTLRTSTKCHPHFHAKPQFSHVLDFPDIFVEQQDYELLDFPLKKSNFSGFLMKESRLLRKEIFRCLFHLNLTTQYFQIIIVPFSRDHLTHLIL